MARVLGWDVGGAHLKAALAEDGEVVGVWRVPAPPDRDLAGFEAALARIAAEAGPADRHAVTMTGELSDVFPDRREGVAALARAARGRLGEGVVFYAGPAGLVPDPEASEAVASANWHAAARIVAERIDAALFLAMGSTTTDITPVAGGAIRAEGFGDAERLRFGELVYQGFSRTALMAVAERVPVAGARVPVIAEPLATMADVRQVLAAVADEDEPADARARIARMIGRDAAEMRDHDFRTVAHAFAEVQLRRLHDAAELVLSRGDLEPDAPAVVAGVGRSVLKRLATRLDRGVVDFADLVECRSALRDDVGEAAAAAALAIIAGRG
ncbi:hydantoinase/oxoprolinase family protein [Aureimonas leprariae]|uniref:S-layer protein n=1 Tax=Plantimonas leprariae TaxID=2615207 RepID=A0A7V7PNM2_9HYPH|nr:hydantoinase/oxoprolinase family protein [Aureimonas leprariae]KAB0679298.1 S-layer protein [Aureimonas leprariae]